MKKVTKKTSIKTTVNEQCNNILEVIDGVKNGEISPRDASQIYSGHRCFINYTRTQMLVANFEKRSLPKATVDTWLGG